MAAMPQVSLPHVAEYTEDGFQQRGVAGLRYPIQHTAGAYRFLAMLHRTAQEQGYRIAWWPPFDPDA